MKDICPCARRNIRPCEDGQKVQPYSPWHGQAHVRLSVWRKVASIQDEFTCICIYHTALNLTEHCESDTFHCSGPRGSKDSDYYQRFQTTIDVLTNMCFVCWSRYRATLATLLSPVTTNVRIERCMKTSTVVSFTSSFDAQHFGKRFSIGLDCLSCATSLSQQSIGFDGWNRQPQRSS